jgi:hypothetical protein
VREKMATYTEYSDFFVRMDHHREKNSARGHLLRSEGFNELNKKYGTDYDYFQKVDEEND